MKIKFLLTIIAFVIVFASCEKGATGPEGPAGQNGAANVKMTALEVPYTDWVQANATNWSYTTNITIPSTDVCEVYVLTGTAGYTPLPTVNLAYLDGGVLYYFYPNVLLCYSNPNSILVTTTLDFNIVDIPPSIQVKYPAIDWRNAREVANLPEVAAVLHEK
jgi:hypothetical protein